MTSACVFCRIVLRESNADIVYEDDLVLAFQDLYPKAPVHLLIIPKRHIESIARLEPDERRGPGGGISGASMTRRLVRYYFRIASAALALSEASVMLPALQAASASFTSEAAFVMSVRGAWAAAVAPVLVRGACTSWLPRGAWTFWLPRGA